MANPSLQIGNSNWAIKEDNLLGYSTAGTRFVPQPITMTRATAGTRVNPSGLVENVQIVSDTELITNGDFATDSDWTKGTGWTISGGTANCDGSQTGTSNLNNSVSNGLVNNVSYVVKYTISNYSAGSIRIKLGNTGYGDYNSANGTYTATLTALVSTFPYAQFNADSSFVGSIDNVSVKEATIDNLPRVDYTDGTSSLLVEPQRTNELTQSNQFDTTWIQSGTLTSGQDGVGGSTDAWKFENPNATSSLYQADTTSGVQTLSAYFKKNSNYGVRFFAFGSVNCSTYFDLNNGAVVSSINSTAKVEPAGADWFRCSMTFDQTTSRCDFYVTNNASTQVLGDYTIQYAQLESGSYATSYIPTDGSTVTRNKDQYEKTGISDLINSEEGVLFVEMAALADDETNREITLSDGSVTNYVLIRFNSGGSNRIYTRVDVGGGVQYFNLDSSHTITDVNKIAIKWKNSDFCTFINGVKVDSQLSGSSFSANTLSELNFDNGSGANNLSGKVKQLQVYNTALTDSELIALTT